MRLIRQPETADGTLGELWLDDHMRLFTLEPHSGDPERFKIPVGEYKCRRFHGNKYPDTFEIIVEGHTALLFHSGNTEKDTHGCVLLGMKQGKLAGKGAVLESAKAFSVFMAALSKQNGFDLSITEA